MTERTRGYAHRIDVTADAHAVWTALTTASVSIWCSSGARISARPHGSFRASVDRITDFEAHIDVYVPERRMRLIHLPSSALPATESALVDDFMLDDRPGGATLRLLGSGFPVDQTWDVVYMRRRTGWELALARLKVLVEREAPHAPDAAGGGLG